MLTMKTTVPSVSAVRGVAPVQGLPGVNYYLPIVVTLLAAGLLLLVLGTLSLFAIFDAVALWGNFARGASDGSALSGMICGVLGLIGLATTAYFFYAMVKGVRDLRTPLYYTRGAVADKKTIGGRMAGNWLAVSARYGGPDRQEASSVSDEERAASTDRSQIFQPRFPQPKKPSSYLPTERISSNPFDPVARRAARQARADRIDDLAKESFGSLSEEVSATPRVVFRVDLSSHAVLEPGEEVLVAHSRFLQHVYYVAHLRNGEWEAFPNKMLI